MRARLWVLTAVLGVTCAVALPGGSSTSDTIRINQGWRFLREASPASDTPGLDPRALPDFDDSRWEVVTLPHAARIEPPTHGPNYFKGVCWYRRRIAVPASWRARHVAIAFDGAMQTADVWVNGRHIATHRGGYLPFVIDLTPELVGRPDLVLALRLDNRADRRFPPGSDRIDFAYYGGLYRSPRLLVADAAHITDPIAADRVAGGGVFVRYEQVSTAAAEVVVQVNVRNDSTAATDVSVENQLLAPDGAPAATSTTPVTRLQPGVDFDAVSRLHVVSPKLWHPNHPYLYRLVTTVKKNGVACDRQQTRCGIRHLAYTDDGFFINGEKLVIRGANRHMSFPWLGNAASDNLQYRDIRLLKDGGFNFVRLAHYPHSSAVMDACDELGLLALVCTPGWQFFDDTEEFRNAARRDVREMIRWHRNHASAVLWEVSLNETYGHDDFYASQVAAAHEEYPGGQLFTSGDAHASRSVRHYDVTYPEWKGFYERPLNADARIRKGLVREYGDYEFGGQESTTRVPRRAGEDALLLQAWNFQWSHNRNLSWPWVLGDAIWAGIDTSSAFDRLDADGMGRGSWWGPLDLYRLPKLSYYFFQSQGEGSMVYLATFWSPSSSHRKVVVFSNGDEVELRLNGRVVGRRKPDAGPDSAYDSSATLDSDHPHATRPFDGGNARHIAHPPFTFTDVSYEPGELKAVAYRNGKAVARDVRRTPGAPVAVRLRAPTLGRPLTAGVSDALFVYADVIDANGETVPDAEPLIRFSAEGAARLVTPIEMRAEAGIAPAIIQAGDVPGAVTIRAQCAGLKSSVLTIAVGAAR